MQTFFVYEDTKLNAQVLDNKRLGKQRVEAIQILRSLIGETDGWKNHPAVKMWKGYEPFLLYMYLYDIMGEWKRRGYRNDKCEEHYKYLTRKIDIDIVKPDWLDENFMNSHRSKLISKNYDYYKPKFPVVEEGLEYIWPV